MSDVYGPRRVFFPRAHDGACDWLPNGPHALDSLTGGQLAIAGDMPVVCSEGFNSRAGLELLALAGLEPAPKRIHYRAREAFGALSACDGKLVVQHAFPDRLWPPGRFWIDPALLRRLNNKARLGELVRADNVPTRKVVDRADCFGSTPRLPAVIKVVSDQSNGGGLGVAVCATAEDWRGAAQIFANCEQVVVESFLDIARNPCLNFAIMPAGEVRYLGFADQDVTSAGKHRGNWIALGSSLPGSVIEAAAEPVRRAAGLGYRGIAGVDLALTRDGEIYVLDLNFRVNASTPAILLAAAIAERRGGVMHFRRIGGPGRADDLATALTPHVEGGRIVPLNLFDAGRAGYSDVAASAQVLVIGDSREDVESVEAELASVGID